MNPFLVGWRAANRRSSVQSGPRHPTGAGTLRNVALELGWFAGQLARPSRALPALLVGITVAALLAPLTPGPVVATGWRIALAVVGAIAAAGTAHVLLQRTGGRDASRGTVAAVGVATVSLLVTTTVMVSYLLWAIAPGDRSTGELLGGGLAVDRPVAAAALLLLAGVLATRLGDRLRVPGALALLGLGMVVGSDGLGWVLVDDPQWVQGVAVVALVVILYEGGLTTRLRSLRGAIAPGVLLATVGVAVTAAVVAVLGTAVLDLPARTAWLLAAVVASTDAAAVFAVLRRTPVSPRLAGVLQVESGTNDPIAVLLTVAFLTAGATEGDALTWVAFGLTQLVVGAALGGAVGAAGAAVLSRASVGAAGLLPVLALAIGGAAYGITALAGGSGFLAVYVCGVTVAARTPVARRSLRSFHEALASSIEVGLFLLLGLLVFPSDLPQVAGAGLAVVAVLLLVARPLAVALGLAPFGFSWRELTAVSWLGMRGAVPIVLATVAFSAGFEDAAWLLDVVFVVVLVSTLVQGVTAEAVVRRLGLQVEREPADVVIDVSPFEGLDAAVIEVRVSVDSSLAGRRLNERPPPEGALVTAVVRGSRIVLPRGTTILLADDLLIVAADSPHAVAQLRAWAGPSTTRLLTGP